MNTVNLLTTLTLPLTLLAVATTAAVAELEPLHVERTGSFRVALPPDQAIWLFTGPGEKLWVPGWEPSILSGDGTEAGTVFVTEHDGHETIWIVVDYDTEALRARYARTTPGLKVGTVEVTLQPDGEGGSTVQVTYELTALSEAGNRDLAHFDEAAYKTMMLEWERLVRDAEAAIAKHFGLE